MADTYRSRFGRGSGAYGLKVDQASSTQASLADFVGVIRVVASPRSLWQTVFHVTVHVTRTVEREPGDAPVPGVRRELIVGRQKHLTTDSKSADGWVSRLGDQDEPRLGKR